MFIFVIKNGADSASFMSEPPSPDKLK